MAINTANRRISNGRTITIFLLLQYGETYVTTKVATQDIFIIFNKFVDKKQTQRI